MKKTFFITSIAFFLLSGCTAKNYEQEISSTKNSNNLSNSATDNDSQDTNPIKNTKNNDSTNPTTDITYQDIIEFVNENITAILNNSFSQKPTNGNWYADGYGFTSPNHVYVDFEDGHFLFRALLKCDNTISCETLAIFENKNQWSVLQGEDTQKNNPIVYKWAKDYEWQR